MGYHYGDDILAAAGQAHLKYSLPLEQTPLALSVGGIYLTGDDFYTDRHEGWNPLYSRWPKWSELYIYTLTRDPGGLVAYWQNLASPWLGLDFTPAKCCTLEGRLYMMWAPEAAVWNDCGPTCTAVTVKAEAFDYRGTLSTLKLKWRVNKYLDGHLLWEMFAPGVYYDAMDMGGDTAHFLRWEIIFNY